MVISWIFLIVSIITLFILPLQYVLIVLIFLFSVLVWYEIYKKGVSLLDVSMWITYTLIGIIYYFFRYENVLPYTGSIIYSVLSVASFLGLIFKRPFTMVNMKEGKEELSKHMFISSFLGVVFLIALYLSVVLFPSSAYIYIPLIVSGVGSVVAVFLGKFLWKIWMMVKELQKLYGKNIFHFSFREKNIKRGKVCLESEKYTIKVFLGDENLEGKKEFFELLKKGYLSVYMKGDMRDEKSYESFFEEIRQEYEKFKDNSYVFVCYDNATKKGVGCIRFVISVEEKRLPLEGFLNISLDFLREKGLRLCEVGRLAISGEGAKRGEILEALGNMFVLFLVSKDIDVVFTAAVGETKNLYEKAGFHFIKREFFDQETLQKAELGFFDTNSYLLRLEEKMTSKRKMVYLLWWVYIVKLWIRRVRGFLKISVKRVKDGSFLSSFLKEL